MRSSSRRCRLPRSGSLAIATRNIRYGTVSPSTVASSVASISAAVASAVLVYVPHTTAGLTINEHADPMVARDFEMALERLVPEAWGWQHVEEGEENAPSHPRASLMGPHVLVPLRDGELALGTWQGIFLCEFDGPRPRSVYVT